MPPPPSSDGAPLDDPERRAAVQRSALLDSPPDEAFDRATRLASRLLDAPVALMSIVDVDRQFFKSQVGLPEPWASERETPLDHSFCQHVVRSGTTLDVADSTRDPRVRGNLAIADLGVAAYLGVPLRDGDGRILGSFCVISHEPREWTPEERQVLADLAEQVRTELRLRKTLHDLSEDMRHRRDLLAMVAHDVRSPAGSIAMSADTLRRLDADDPRRDQIVDGIERQAHRITRLSDALLSVDHPRTDGRADLAILVEGAVEAAEGPNRSGRVHWHAPSVQLALDELAVSQIVTNLVNNALKHTDAAVDVSAQLRDGALELVVRDHGSGIPGSLADDLFEPFRRGAGAGRGHGLGLYIVKSLVERLGGTIDVATGAEGTRFTVELPAQRAGAR